MIERLKVLLAGLETDSVLSSELEELRGILDAFGRAGARKVQGWFRVDKHPGVGNLEWRIDPGAFSDKVSLRHNGVDLLNGKPLSKEPPVLAEGTREDYSPKAPVRTGALAQA